MPNSWVYRGSSLLGLLYLCYFIWVLSILIDGIGTFCMTIGGLFALVGVVGIFTRSSTWVRNVIEGVTLLWIGCWCTGAFVNFFGFLIGEATSSGGSGYH